MENSMLADVSPMIEREREIYKKDRAAQPRGIAGLFSHDEDFESRA